MMVCVFSALEILNRDVQEGKNQIPSAIRYNIFRHENL